MPSSSSVRQTLVSTLTCGAILGTLLALSACGNGDSASSQPSAAPTTAAAPAPVAADQVASCVQGKGLSLSTNKKKADGARFDADLELQISVDPASSYLGVFVYPDAASAGAAKTKIDQAGASGTEVVNNSVFAGAAGFTAPDAKANVDKVRGCATSGT